MSASPLPLADMAGIAHVHAQRTDRVTAGLELALDAAALLFLPVLTMASLGTAPLAIVAEICALGLVLRRGEPSLRALLYPAILLGLLLLWGALSALWSIHPLRTLEIAGRLAGLFVGALALAAAADRLAYPVRLLACALIGAGLAVLLAIFELATHGVLSAMLYHHAYFPTGLNRGVVGLTVLLLPALATAMYLRRPILGAVLGLAVVVVVFALKATIAKVILPVAVIAGCLVLVARTAVARTAAIAAVLVVLTAPLTFSQLAEMPGALDQAYEFKESLAHRLEIWNFVGERIAERPVLGWGLDASRAIPGGNQPIRPGENWLPLHPHNAALQLWLELGLPGSALFASLAALLWLRLGRADGPLPFVAAMGGGLLAAMIAAFASYDIWHEWWIGTLSLMLFLVCVMGGVCRAAAAAGNAPPLRL